MVKTIAAQERELEFILQEFIPGGYNISFEFVIDGK